MATRSSAWSFDSGAVLLGCGIDAEEVSRFEDIAREGGFPFVFSERELAHCRNLKNPARGLCAAFCCKEALRKAIGRPYNFCDFTVLLDERTMRVEIDAGDSVMEENPDAEIHAEVARDAGQGEELVAVVVVQAR